MWYDTLKGEWPEIFREKLVDEKKYVDIGDMFAAVDVTELLKAGKLTEAREKTLTYLHTLLQEGKVKVMMVKYRQATRDEIEKSDKRERKMGRPEVGVSRSVLVPDWIREYQRDTADVCINDLRAGWNDDPYKAFEGSVFITLPGNTFDWTPTEKFRVPEDFK